MSELSSHTYGWQRDFFFFIFVCYAECDISKAEQNVNIYVYVQNTKIIIFQTFYYKINLHFIKIQYFMDESIFLVFFFSLIKLARSSQFPTRAPLLTQVLRKWTEFVGRGQKELLILI
jgi:hypothetical protein